MDEDDQIARFLNIGGTGAGVGEGDASNYELDPGEKDENAIDYEDMSDDDLPEEEEATAHPDVGATDGDDADADLTAQLPDDFILTLDRHIFRLEIVLKIDAHFLFRQIAQMPHGSLDHILRPQIFADGLGLGGRLDDDELAARACAGGTHGAPVPLLITSCSGFVAAPTRERQ